MASDFLSVISELFGKIASFFDVFDLSFFVSGSLCLAAISFWLRLSGVNSPFILDSWLRIFELVVFCYVLGLITFTSGRWLRTGFIGRRIRCIFNTFKDDIYSACEIAKGNAGNPRERKQEKHLNSRDYFLTLLKSHGLDEVDFIKIYDSREINPLVADCLYQRMWAEVRQCKELSPSSTLLNRWWVMTATYDGIAMNLILYIIIIIIWLNGIGLNEEYSILIKTHPYYEYSIAAIFVLMAFSIASFREAKRLELNQRAEIVATMAHYCANPKYRCKNGADLNKAITAGKSATQEE